MNVFNCILLKNGKIIHGQDKILDLCYVSSTTAMFSMWRLVIHFSKLNIVGLRIWSFLLACCRHVYWLNHTTDSSRDFWLYPGSHYGLCSYSAVTSASHGNQAAEYSLMDFAPLVTCRCNIVFLKTNMKQVFKLCSFGVWRRAFLSIYTTLKPRTFSCDDNARRPVWTP